MGVAFTKPQNTQTTPAPDHEGQICSTTTSTSPNSFFGGRDWLNLLLGVWRPFRKRKRGIVPDEIQRQDPGESFTVPSPNQSRTIAPEPPDPTTSKPSTAPPPFTTSTLAADSNGPDPTDNTESNAEKQSISSAALPLTSAKSETTSPDTTIPSTANVKEIFNTDPGKFTRRSSRHLSTEDLSKLTTRRNSFLRPVVQYDNNSASSIPTSMPSVRSTRTTLSSLQQSSMFASTASETPETSLPQVRPNTSTSKVTINRPPSWNRRKQSSPSESNDSESKLKSEFVAEEEEPMGGARIRRGSVSMVLLPTSGQNQRSESIMKITWFNALSAKSTRTSSEEQESPTASDVRRSGPGNGLDKDEGNTTDKPPSEVNARLPLIKPRFAFNDKAIQSTVDINDLGRQRSTLQVKPVVPLDSSLESSQLTNSLPSVSSQSQRSIYTASTSNNRRPHGSGLEGGQRDTSGSGSRIEHRRSHTQRSSGTSSVDRRTSYSSNDNTAGFYEGDKNIHSIAENPDERSVNGDGSSTHKRLRRENSTPAMSMKSRPRKDSYYAVASAERARKLAASKRKLSMELEEIRYANLLATIPKVASVVELDDVP